MPKLVRDPNALYCDDPSLAQQHFAEECDINQIIARAQAGQIVTHVQQAEPIYGDFTTIPSYSEAFAAVKRAEALFMALPWQVRERFSNDPQQFLNFVQDPKNAEEAGKLGLLRAKVQPKADVPVSETSSPTGDSGANGAKPEGAAQ